MSWRSLDAHLIKAATPAVSMGNRIGRECQEAIALGASVEWADEFLLYRTEYA